MSAIWWIQYLYAWYSIHRIVPTQQLHRTPFIHHSHLRGRCKHCISNPNATSCPCLTSLQPKMILKQQCITMTIRQHFLYCTFQISVSTVLALIWEVITETVSVLHNFIVLPLVTVGEPLEVIRLIPTVFPYIHLHKENLLCNWWW